MLMGFPMHVMLTRGETFSFLVKTSHYKKVLLIATGLILTFLSFLIQLMQKNGFYFHSK